MNTRIILPMLAALACARGFDVPGAPGPGSVSGRLVVLEPGTNRALPASGALVQLLRSNVRVTAGADGRFRLAPITSSEGTLLIQYDAAADGTAERQRLMTLREIGAGPGRDIALGDVALRENATLRGRVLRGDLLDQRAGHAGSTVFVPEGPFTTYSGDDGSWLLLGVPEGAVTVAFFRGGYAPASLDAVTVRPGESLTFRDVVLQPDPAPAAKGTLSGEVRFRPAADPTQALVKAHSTAGETTLTLQADGKFSHELDVGLYTVDFSLTGYQPVSVYNVPVWSGAEAQLPPVTLDAEQPPPPPPPPPPTGLIPPTALITSPIAGRPGAEFELDASTSSAPSGHAFTFAWRQTQGDAVALLPNAAVARPRFVAPLAPQILAFDLVVTDVVTGLNAAASTSIAFNDPPTARVAEVGIVEASTLVTLDATSSIAPAGHALSFHWRQNPGSPDEVVLSANDSESASTTTFNAPPTEQRLTFTVTVRDTTTDLTSSATVPVEVAEPPVARIGSPAAAATSREHRLDGSGSTAPAGRALLYAWTQTQGPEVTLSINDSALAARPTFLAPADPVKLGFTLRVVDVQTGLEDTASQALDVVHPPVAAIRPVVVQVPPGAVFTLDGRGSSDPLGAPLTYRWALSGGGSFQGTAAAEPVARIASPAAEASLVVSLEVSNGFLWSEKALATVEVRADASLAPTVDAGPNRTAGMGEVVTLSADASSPIPGEPITYAWSQIDGTPLVTLIDSDKASAQFIAPQQQALLTFRITVETESGESASDDVVIEVRDTEAPQVVEADPAQGMSGSWLYASARFDEPLDPASVTTATVQIRDASSNPVPAAVKWDPATRTVKVLPHAPLASLAAHTFFIGAVSDTATPPNVHADQTITYTVRAPQWRTWSSAPNEAQPVPPRPSVAALSSTDVVVAAQRKDAACGESGAGGTWLLVPDNGSALVTQPVCEAADTATFVTRSAHAAGGTFFATIAGAPTLKRTASGWQALAGVRPGGTMYSDGASIFSGTGENVASPAFAGSRHSAMNLGDGSFASEFTYSVAYNSSQSFYVYGAAGNDFPAFVTRRLWNSGAGGTYGFWPALILVHERYGGAWAVRPKPSAWQSEAYGIYAVPIGDVHQPRLAYAKGAPFAIWIEGATWTNPPTPYVVKGALYNRAGATWTSPPFTNINSRGGTAGAGCHEIIGQRSLVYYAYTTGGQLYLRRINMEDTSPAFADMDGPNGASQNVDASCTASHPMMATLDEALFLTWHEDCAGAHRVHLRKLY